MEQYTPEKSQKELYPKTLRIEEKDFLLVRVRDYDQGAIYQSGEVYARVAPQAVLQKEYETHQFFEEKGFPMPKLLSGGIVGENAYYLEEDIGRETFHDKFEQETRETGKITEETFQDFLSLVKKFVGVQEKSVSSTRGVDEGFFRNVMVHEVIGERSELQLTLAAMMLKTEKVLGVLPQVPTHGDFNPCNILPKGVIDFAYHFEAPLGYDWTALLMNTYYFSPEDTSPTEINRTYQYTEDQWEKLVAIGDQAYKDAGITKTFRETLPILALMRMTWSAAHMEHRPQLQAWRFAKLQRALEVYLQNPDALSEEEGQEILAILKG